MKNAFHRLTSTTKATGAIFLLLALPVFVLGTYLRLHHLGEQSYWMDEGYTINAVLSIQEKGSSVLDSGFGYSCPLYCYPTAFIADHFGNTAESYRALAAFSGIILIIALFFIVRSLFSKNIALITSLFLSLSYWQIAWSREARWYTLFTLFFWLSLYFFYTALNSPNNKKRNIVLTALFTTLTILTHGLGYVLPFLFVGWYSIDAVFIKKTFPARKLLLVGAIGIGAVAALSFVKELPIRGIELHNIFGYYLSFYLRTYWLFIPFITIALLAPSQYKKQIHFLSFSFLAYLLPLSFLTEVLHYRYLFHLTPALVLLGTIGMSIAYAKIAKPSLKKAYIASITLLFITLGGGVIIPQSNYYLESDDPATLGERSYYAYTPQPNWNAAYAYVRDHKEKGDIIISSHPHFNKIFLGEAGFWLKYNYLGMSDTPSNIVDDREYYVGAKVIDDLSELKSILDTTHGYIVIDYMAQDGRIPDDMVSYIVDNTKLGFHEKTKTFSEVWVFEY